MKLIESVWFIEVHVIENNNKIKIGLKTTCQKLNTAMERAWKWCKKHNRGYVDYIDASRLKEDLSCDISEYKNIK